MELEMFANSLDLYESLDSNLTHKLKHNHLLFSDEADEREEAIGNPEEEQIDENETSDSSLEVQYLSERVQRLYQYIVSCLVGAQMHKEALLVSERQRTKHCPHLDPLPELLSYTQIEKCLSETNIDSILYFSKIDTPTSSSLNCWLIKRHEFIEYKQIDLSSFSNIFSFDNGFNELLTSVNSHEREKILDSVCSVLIKPFEEFLVSSEPTDKIEDKRLICLIYDEEMLQVPFHLLKSNNRFVFDLFEIDCVYSMKYLLFKTKSYNQKFTKHNAENKNSIPMKTVSNETDLARLLSSPPASKLNTYQFDLVLIFISSDNRGTLLVQSL
jgi:hypothetical protein